MQVSPRPLRQRIGILKDKTSLTSNLPRQGWKFDPFPLLLSILDDFSLAQQKNDNGDAFEGMG